MQRNKKIILLSHCILNANSKIEGIALYQGAIQELVVPLISRGYGLVQLPCPELLAQGLTRWGQVKEQYNTPYYRKHCRALLEPIIDQLLDYHANGYELSGCIGVDGSPNCGVNLTCSAAWGGELSNNPQLPKIMGTLKESPEAGVFIEIFQELLAQNNLKLNFYAIDEANPSISVEGILKELL
ncbi:CD3072 family TudS-related putative desulfidase [Sulfurospirillum sp. 1612]|uniref:CD3072 family TudS-related putative desulfidase n=1 Tax=Sulfurospirillum sp. 1612 TaxID=3094835 RepID=UPI002F94ADD4